MSHHTVKIILTELGEIRALGKCCGRSPFVFSFVALCLGE